MGAIFIAIFGLLYWGCKLSNEKNQTKQSEKERVERREKINNQREKFESRVVDRHLEADLEDLIYNIENFDEVWAEVSKAYDEMSWMPDEEKFLCFTHEAVEKAYGKGTYTKKQRKQIIDSYRTEALRIMLANRGKLRYRDTFAGISSFGQGAPTLRAGERLNIQSANFVLWIDSKLKEHGVYEPVYIHTHCHNYIPLTSNSKKTYGGEYFWKPEILFMDTTPIFYEDLTNS